MNSTIAAITGRRGEDAAMEWLREHGYYIVERNWRIGSYEIDIIAEHYDTLHFVEVKTRQWDGWQSAYDSINDQKRRTLHRGAMAYMAMHRGAMRIQFDLIAVTVEKDDSLTIELTEEIL